jgi:hypothetical protein
MTLTDYAAWWGAVIATAVLVWDIYKWASTGAKIVLTVLPNRFTMGDDRLDGQRLFLFEATNKGDRPTTLGKLMFVHYSGVWQFIRRKPTYYYIKNPGFQHNFPHKLDVGDVWQGSAFHTDESDTMMRKGYLYAALFCSDRSRPVVVRVRPAKEKDTKTD